MSWLSSPRFLSVYSGALTLVFAWTVLTGFSRDNGVIEEVRVQRINIVEPDGTLRMVISNKARAPGIYMRGKEYLKGQRQTAGVIFLNDEGSENGGLTFGGAKSADGTVTSHGHLSFDRYMQDQVLALTASQRNDDLSATLAMLDRPGYPITELLELLERIKNWPPEQQQAELERFNATHPQPQRRIALARETDRSVSLQLRDTEGRARIVMRVDAQGEPRLQFLDAGGNVIGQMPQ